MNTNPSTKRVLCYGDSLTFGDDPVNNTRHPANVRWTGVLQDLLGSEFEIIEEGLGGRTTNVEHPDLKERNGLKYFIGCVESHVPLDLVILMLGTNDLHTKLQRNAAMIAGYFYEYDKAIKAACEEWGFSYPKVLLLSPPMVSEAYVPQDWGFVGAEEKSKQFALEYQKVANKLGFEFLDLAPIAKPSKIDGVHLEVVENRKIGEAVFKKIKDIE